MPETTQRKVTFAPLPQAPERHPSGLRKALFIAKVKMDRQREGINNQKMRLQRGLAEKEQFLQWAHNSKANTRKLEGLLMSTTNQLKELQAGTEAGGQDATKEDQASSQPRTWADVAKTKPIQAPAPLPVAQTLSMIWDDIMAGKYTDKQQLVLREEISNLRKENENLSAMLQESKDLPREDDQQEKEALKSQVKILEDRNQRLHGEKNVLQEENKKLREEKNKLQEENRKLQGENRKLQGQNNKLQEENCQLLEDKNKEQQEKTKKCEEARHLMQINDSLNGRISSMDQHIQKLLAEKRTFISQAHEANSRIRCLETEQLDRAKKFTILTEQHADCEKKLLQSNGVNQSLSESLAKMEAKATDSDNTIKQLEKDVALRAEEKKESLKNQKELEDSNKGLQERIKELEEKNQELQDLCLKKKKKRGLFSCFWR